MAKKELLVKQLREDLKKHRDRFRKTSDAELRAIGAMLDSILLVTYDPIALIDLCDILSSFLNDQLGGEN